ncbi:MAG: hypothetical protein RLY78_2811 [Pseudomonadota bacterium]
MHEAPLRRPALTVTRPLMMSVMLAAAGLMLGACGTPASTAGHTATATDGHSRAAFMAAHDTDRDGTVTRAEYDAVRHQRFAAGDRDGNGVLDEAEYVAEFEARLKRQYLDEQREPDPRYERAIRQAHVRFALVDRDRDGRYTREEDLAAAARTFRGHDTNADQRVDRLDPLPPPRRPAAADADADADAGRR